MKHIFSSCFIYSRLTNLRSINVVVMIQCCYLSSCHHLLHLEERTLCKIRIFSEWNTSSRVVLTCSIICSRSANNVFLRKDFDKFFVSCRTHFKPLHSLRLFSTKWWMGALIVICILGEKCVCWQYDALIIEASQLAPSHFYYM